MFRCKYIVSMVSVIYVHLTHFLLLLLTKSIFGKIPVFFGNFGLLPFFFVGLNSINNHSYSFGNHFFQLLEQMLKGFTILAFLL